MTRQKTNFNRNPYFDDYRPEDNIQKVLFKAGFPIQSRELNNLQGILQNQINSLSTNILKEGTVVIPGELDYNLETPGILVRKDFNGVDLSEYKDSLVGLTIIGRISGVRAKIIHYLTEKESSIGVFTLYLKIFSTSVDNNFDFVPNELLDLAEPTNIPLLGFLTAGTSIARTVTTNPNIIGSLFSVNSGVYYVRGYFSNVSAQIFAISQYDSLPTCKIGFDIEELIINSTSDNNLLDNASGYEGYGLPGADRFQINCILGTRNIESSHDINYIELARFNNGVLEEIKRETEYNIIGDYIAERFKDINGNLVVDDFDVTLNSINNDIIDIKISSGKAYIDGYEVEKLVPEFIQLPNAKETESSNNNSIEINISSNITAESIQLRSSNFPLEKFKIENTQLNYPIGEVYIREIYRNIDNKFILYVDFLNFYSLITFEKEIPNVLDETRLEYNNNPFYVVNKIDKNKLLVYGISGVIRNGASINISNNNYTISSVVNYSFANANAINGLSLTAILDPSKLFYNNTENSKLVKLPIERPKTLSDLIISNQVVVEGTSTSNQTLSISLGNNRSYDFNFYPILFTPNGNQINLTSVNYQNNYNTVILTGDITSGVTYTLVHRERISNAISGTRKINKAAVIQLNSVQNISTPFIPIGIPGLYEIYGIYENLPEISFSLTTGNTLSQGEIIYNSDKSKKAIVISSTSTVAQVSFLTEDIFTVGELFQSSETTSIGTILAVNNQFNVKSDFEFYDGQTSSYIEYPLLYKRSPSTYNTLYVVGNIFESVYGSGSFFGISSYNQDSYEYIPKFNGVSLFNHLDFRPTVSSKKLSGNGTYTFPYTFDQSFDYENKYKYLYTPENKFKSSLGRNVLIYDAVSYKDRAYLIYLNNNKQFEFFKQESKETNNSEQNRLLVSVVEIKGNAFEESDVKIQQYFYKNYKMQDIEKLENRIETLEKQITLSNLERKTLYDNDYLSDDILKLKTGILVEEFEDSLLADNDPDNNYSIDMVGKKLYPKSYNRFHQLKLLSNNVKYSARHQCFIKNYTHLLYSNNDVGNRVTTVSTLSNTKKESLEILNYGDCWVNTKKILSNKPIIDNLSFEENNANSWQYKWFGENGASSYFGTNKVNGISNKFIIRDSKYYLRRQLIPIHGYFLNGNSPYDVYFRNTKINQYFIPGCISITYNQQNTLFSPGDIVVLSSGMKLRVGSPNESFYYSNPFGKLIISPTANNYNAQELNRLLFFDLTYGINNYDLSEITDIILKVGDTITLENNPTVSATIKSLDIITDNVGNLSGLIYIPDTLRDFEITDQLIKVELVSPTTNSKAEAEYFVYGMPRQNKFRIESKDEQFPNVAQIFTSNNNQFISKINLYFATIESSSPIEISIRRLVEGVPSNEILPFSNVTLKPNEIKLVEPTSIIFDIPVYIEKDKDYCVCIKTTGEFKLFSTLIGDVINNLLISPIPLLKGVLKLGSNTTYIPSPYELLKIDIFRAKFDIGTTAALVGLPQQNKINYGKRNLRNNPIVTTQGSSIISIEIPHHGFYKNNSVVMISGALSEISPTVSQTGVVVNNTPTIIQLKVLYSNQILPKGQLVSPSNPGFIKVNGAIIQFTGIDDTQRRLTGCTIVGGGSVSIANGDKVEWYLLNGIPLNLINKLHTVTSVTYDTLRINVGSGIVANRSSRVGGNSVVCSEQINYFQITPSFVSLLPPTSNSIIRYRGVSFNTENYDSYVNVNNGSINTLKNLHYLPSDSNLNPQFEITLESGNDKVSPVYDLKMSGVVFSGYRSTSNNGIRNSGVFITKPIDTKSLSKSIRVFVSCRLNGDAAIKVFVRSCLKEYGKTLDKSEWYELSLINITPMGLYDERLYSIANLENFNQFQIRIESVSNNNKSVPVIENMRLITYV